WFSPVIRQRLMWCNWNTHGTTKNSQSTTNMSTPVCRLVHRQIKRRDANYRQIHNNQPTTAQIIEETRTGLN
ncbi:hypothetical protein T265_02417, partial [Opisthorchis viverrini]